MKYQHTLMRSLPRSVAIVVASFIIGSTSYAASAPLFGAVQHTFIESKTGTSVRVRKSYTAKDRTDYKRALEIYNVYYQQGKTDLIPPNINDRATIDLYLKNLPAVNRVPDDDTGTPVSTKDYVPPEKESISTIELSAEERSTLAQYMKVGKCWKVPRYSAGFYDLCLQLIKGKEVKRTSGFETDLQMMRVKASGAHKAATSAPGVMYPEKDIRGR